MPEFGLLDSFGIDDGELEHLDRHECFVLGVEWQTFRQELDKCRRYGRGEFKQLVHASNEQRLSELADKYGFTVSRTLENDSWATLHCRRKYQ